MKLLFGIMTAVTADAPDTSMTPSNSSTVLCTKLASASLLVTCHLSLPLPPLLLLLLLLLLLPGLLL